MRHELTHYKHLDMFYKWLVQITVCLHWFNPFAYRLAKEISKDCELFCDETMIRTMNENEKKAYGDTLLDALNAVGNYNDKIATVTLTEGAEQLKERLDAISECKVMSRLAVAGMLVFTLVLATGAAAIGAYAAMPDKQASTTLQSTTGVNGGNSCHYFQAPYLFEIRQNLNENERNAYVDKITVTVADKTSITIFFDASCKKYANNAAVLDALKTLMEKFVDADLPMKTSLICSVDYVGNSDFNKLAAEDYSGNRMDKFIAIFSELEVSTQKMYCDKMYADGKIDFFATVLQIMGTDTIPHYVEKAYADGKVNFMSLMLSLLSDEAKGEWVVTIAPDLLSKVETDSQTRQWLEENLKLIPNTINQTRQNAASNGARVVSCNISFDGYDSTTTQVHVVYEVESGTDEIKKP